MKTGNILPGPNNIRVHKIRLGSTETHGLYLTRVCTVWTAIKNNCCEEWLDLRVFKDWADQNGWESKKKVYRYDETLPYTPENCYLEFTNLGDIINREYGEEIRESEAPVSEIAEGLNVDRSIISKIRKGNYT